jgi:nucleotide-binding universal stress UspA family protein
LKTRILLASNGGKPARAAGLLLRRLADVQRVEVTVNVCDSVEFAFPAEPWSYGSERKPRAQPAEVSESEVAAFRAEGFDVDSIVGSGVPAEQIVDQVKAGDYDIAAMGAGSAKWVDNYLLGSTSTRVLHSSEKSVLIVHRFDDVPGRVRVLIATDGSADAGEAVEIFGGLADPKKVTVRVASVADEVPTIARLVPEGLQPSEVAAYLKGAAQKSAQTAAGPLRELGFEVDTVCPAGEPVREILALAKDANLVVCGSRGMGGASRFLLGSVSDQLVRLAPATLVCRRADRSEPPQPQ